MEVYLDNSATTACFPEVAKYMTHILCEDYGNPSSMHRKGVESEKYLRYAREVIAKNLQVVDMTASILARDNKMPMWVFGLEEENSIVNTVNGNFSGTRVIV